MTRGVAEQRIHYGRKRDADGKPLCSLCAGPLPKGRRSWCSQACVDRYMMQHQGYARSKVGERDHGICALCGVHPDEFHGPRRIDKNYMVTDYSDVRHPVRYYRTRPVMRWEADHIVPLVEGGAHTIENLRTLCRSCHLAETKKLRARLAERKRTRGAA